MEFLADVWGTDQCFVEKIGERTLFVTHGESCTKISVDAQGSISSGIVLELCSNQEEADTRMFLHSLHASNAGHQQILIKSSNTDVEVLACYYRENITADIFLLSGTRSRARVIPVSQVCEQLGVEVCQALPGLHALTGCDTVSSFAGKGKKVALDIVKADEGSRASILRIGERVPPMRRDLNEMEKFVHFTMTLTVVRSTIRDTSYSAKTRIYSRTSFLPLMLPYRSIYNAQTTKPMFGSMHWMREF